MWMQRRPLDVFMSKRREGEELEPKVIIAEYYLWAVLKSGQSAMFCGKMLCLAETCYGVTTKTLSFPLLILSCILLSLQYDSPSSCFYQ